MKAKVQFRPDNPEHVTRAAQEIIDLKGQGFKEYSCYDIGPHHIIVFERRDLMSAPHLHNRLVEIVGLDWLHSDVHETI